MIQVIQINLHQSGKTTNTQQDKTGKAQILFMKVSWMIRNTFKATCVLVRTCYPLLTLPLSNWDGKKLIICNILK